MEKELLEKIESQTKAQIEGAIGKMANKEDIASLMTKLEEVKTLNENEMSELKEAARVQGNWINEQNAKGTETKSETIADAIITALKANGINSFEDLRKNSTLLKQGFEVKTNYFTSASQTGTIGRTQEVSPARFPENRPLAFIPNVKGGTITNGKSVLLWTPSSYTANTGYAGENSNSVTENTGAALEKTRQTAKISAKQYISAETFEDLPQFAQRLNIELQSKAFLFLDNEVLNGDGNDSTQPNHIYGIIGQGSTAFDAANAAKVAKPNVGDLVDACATQAEIALHLVNKVWMHPKTANKLRRTKDADGQYLINQILGGGEVMGAFTVVRTSAIGENELLVANDQAIQLWMKRNLTMRMVQAGQADVENDRFTAILFARAQVLVEDEDKKAVIYVEDIDAALALITE